VLKITINQRINKHELLQIFNNYLIDWDAVEYMFKKEVGKIEYIYLKCVSDEEAMRLYNDKSNLFKKYSNFDLKIHSLLDSIENLIAFLKREILRNKNLNGFEIFNFGLLIFPPSNIVIDRKDFDKKFSKKRERIETIREYIENTIKLNTTQFCIINCLNSITNEKNYEYFLIGFKSKESKDKFYMMQNNLNYAIFHNLTHIKFLPLLRKLNNLNFCLNCNEKKDSKCLFDLCESCCIVTKENHIKNVLLKEFRVSGLECAHRANIKESYLSSSGNEDQKFSFRDQLRSEKNYSLGSNGFCINNKAVPYFREEKKVFCRVCNEDIIHQFLNCPNNLCFYCCLHIAEANKICQVHSYLSKNQIRIYGFFKSYNLECFSKEKTDVDIEIKENKKLYSEEKSLDNSIKSFRNFLLFYNNRLSKIKLKILESLKNSDFSWFRPINDREITRSILDMNKELQTIMDNYLYFRENPLRLSDKMYKIFTFQNEKFIEKNYDKYKSIEGYDMNGEYFFEINFDNRFDNQYHKDIDNNCTLKKLLENNDSELIKQSVENPNFYLNKKNQINPEKQSFEELKEKKGLKARNNGIEINQIDNFNDVYLKTSSHTYQ